MRKIVNIAFAGICALCTAAAGAIILGIVVALLWKGLPAMSWKFLTFDQDEGIGYHFLGTLILISTALLVAAPVATSFSLILAVFTPPGRLRRALSVALYSANGVPSILFGIFGFWFFVKFLGWDKSWLAGGIILGIMIVPGITLALVERIESIPDKYTLAARGLGLRQSQTIWSVILPQSASGLFTGSLLGLARAAGEVAPIMFTATIFQGATIPNGIRDSPVLSLPYHIFNLAQDTFDDDARAKLWATAVILLGIVAVLALVALPIRLRIHEEANHA